MNINKLFDYSQPLVAAATILMTGGLVLGILATYTAYDIKLAQDSLEVTGSAKQAVVADTARWIINLETKTGINNQQQGYANLEQATSKIAAYLESQGFTDFETPAVTSYPNYMYQQYGEPIFTGYNVARQIIVRSDDVMAISQLANNIEPFTGTNYNVTTQSLELTYSKLDQIRVELLSKAIKDARLRADAIAKDSDRTVSTLRNASSGVVQVLPLGGVDISDYGSYDTQSLQKEVMVTVRATFEL
jgi:hypothetical protein